MLLLHLQLEIANVLLESGNIKGNIVLQLVNMIMLNYQGNSIYLASANYAMFDEIRTFAVHNSNKGENYAFMQSHKQSEIIIQFSSECDVALCLHEKNLFLALSLKMNILLKFTHSIICIG